MISGGVCVVALKNPVSSAMGMIGSFIGIAALLIGLNAYFVGTLQVLVYAGAIMVLFLFIIMLLDLKKEENKKMNMNKLAAGVVIPVLFVGLMIPVLSSLENTEFKKLDAKALRAAEESIPGKDKEDKDIDVMAGELAKSSSIRTALNPPQDDKPNIEDTAPTLPDVKLIGQRLFTHYNFPLQVVGVLLLVATIGCVALSKRIHDAPITSDGVKSLANTLPKTDAIPEVPASASSDKVADEKTDSKPVVISLDEPTAETVKADTAPQPEGSSIDEKRGLIYTDKPADIDDLKVISGVGPVLENKLNDFGIYTYKQIADWSEANITEFDDLLTFKGRILRDNWLTQAAELHAKKHNA